MGGVPVPSRALAAVAAAALSIALLAAALQWSVGGETATLWVDLATLLLDGLTVAALLFLSWTLVLGAIWESSDLTTLGGLVALAYPFGDVVVTFFIVLAVLRMTGAPRLSLWCLLGGLLAMSLSDSVYAYLTGVKDFESGGVLDAGWFAAYLGIALSAHLANTRGGVAREERGCHAPPLASLVVPFLPLLLALGVLGIQVQLGDRPDLASVVIALGLLALVLARQALLLLDAGAGGVRESLQGTAP